MTRRNVEAMSFAWAAAYAVGPGGACLWYFVMPFCPVIGWRWGPGRFAIPRQKCVWWNSSSSEEVASWSGLYSSSPRNSSSSVSISCSYWLCPIGQWKPHSWLQQEIFFWYLNLHLHMSPPPLSPPLSLSASICLCMFLWCKTYYDHNFNWQVKETPKQVMYSVGVRLWCKCKQKRLLNYCIGGDIPGKVIELRKKSHLVGVFSAVECDDWIIFDPKATQVRGQPSERAGQE